jgi:hypothetical protein
MRVLAYRIQAAAFGDLDRTILRRLRDDALESGDARPFAPRGPTTKARRVCVPSLPTLIASVVAEASSGASMTETTSYCCPCVHQISLASEASPAVAEADGLIPHLPPGSATRRHVACHSIWDKSAVAARQSTLCHHAARRARDLECAAGVLVHDRLRTKSFVQDAAPTRTASIATAKPAAPAPVSPPPVSAPVPATPEPEPPRRMTALQEASLDGG